MATARARGKLKGKQPKLPQLRTGRIAVGRVVQLGA